MENALYVALSQQMALRRMLDVTANNVANMSTQAFRAERPVFDDFVSRTGRGADPTAFVIDRATYTDTREGALTTTGNPFDIAIRGDGWLQVETAAGPRYTRDGRLGRSADGDLVTVDGAPVLDDAGNRITVPEDVGPLTIAADGTLSYKVEGGEGAQSVELGRIGLYALPGAEGLQRGGDGLVTASGQALPAMGVTIVQGALEGSNVQPIVEMVRLIDLTRAYGQSVKLTEAENDRQRGAINKLGGPAT